MKNQANIGKRGTPRVCVIGIDGVPYTFLKEQFSKGRMKSFSEIEGELKQMSTVLPPISSVAWASFQTGVNSAKHGIFGFIDRDPLTMDIKIPTQNDLRARTIAEILSDNGMRVIQMNVPCSYPPMKVNGILISCFLASNIEKGVYPKEYASLLKDMGYVIDVDPWKARQNRDSFLDDIFHALKKRIETALYLLENEPWDFFMCHIMETDRFAHFFWEDFLDNKSMYGERGIELFELISDFIRDVSERVGEDTEFIVLSDHGFCKLKKEVYINKGLSEAGFLSLSGPNAKSLKDISPGAFAYSMIPGRFYVNLKGREKNGSVAAGDYDRVISDLTEYLTGLTNPEDGSPIIKQTFRKEQIYQGPLMEQAADMIAVPNDGYDLKGNFDAPSLFIKDIMQGMHTDWDASLFIRGRIIKKEKPVIYDVFATIMDMLLLNNNNYNSDGNSLVKLR